jgi:rod shape-determining protein MreD
VRRHRNTLIALGLVLVSLVLQTTLFNQIRPFAIAPSVVLLTVIACARYLEPEAALLIGFTAGLLTDLVGGSSLGLWAIAMTAVAFATIKLRHREVDGILVVALGVFGLTFAGQLLYAIVGTLFGHGTINQPELWKHLVLPALWNVVLAAPIFWVSTLTMRRGERGWAL